ncbi:MAG: nicotinate-nucleotide diphosphorylase (carboxylating), partial [Lysobacteraceae bacterium]
MSDHLPISALPDIVIEPLVRLALEEDFGRGGDITTDAVIPASARMRAVMGAREGGVAAGYDAARLALRLVDPDAVWTTLVQEGVAFDKGAALVRIEGSARSVLMAERVMLNFVGPLSGIATLTAKFVAEVKGTN